MVSEMNTSIRARLVRIREIEREQGLAVAERSLVELIRAEATTSPEAFVALSRILMKGRKIDDALRAAQKARALAPLEADPHILIGVIQMRQKDHVAAGESFARALQLDKSSTRATLGAAAVKLAAEDFEAAEELCDRVLELDPSMERAHELAARVQMKQGKTDEALAELRTLIKKNPDNQRALKAYLGVLRRDGRAEEAVQFLEGEVEANPDDRRRQRMLTSAAARAGNLELASAPYREKLEGGEVNKVDRVRHAVTLIKAGQMDEARAMIAELGSQKALKPIVTTLEADIALKSGDLEGAIELYRQSCRLARLDPLDEAEASAATTPQELAKAWRQHATRSVVAAARSRRGGRAEA